MKCFVGVSTEFCQFLRRSVTPKKDYSPKGQLLDVSDLFTDTPRAGDTE